MASPFMKSLFSKYTPISEADTDADYESSEKLLGGTDRARPLRQSILYRIWPWLANGAIFCLSLTLFALSLRPRELSDAQCGRQLSTFSPAQEAIDYHTVKFNGTFDVGSIYRGAPNPELDAAWNRLTEHVQPTRISKDMLAKMGKEDRPSLVKFREEDGGGYMASVETVHQLHCLNMLRKFTYHEYYEERHDKSFPPQVKLTTFRTHLDHCVEMIRQNIMCAADTGLITYDWVRGWSLPYPDFNTVHQCRDYEKVLGWAYSNAVHIPRDHVSRWEDTVDLTSPP